MEEESSEEEVNSADYSDQEDVEVEDENFEWYNNKVMRDDTYFVLVNCDRRVLRAGEQAYYCYGKRSNAFLLLK